MAPSKKSKSVNREIVSAGDSSISNVDDKSKHKRRKLRDKLGPQWSKHEIECFYDAYRKYGQDWKKVAAVVRHRSVAMVQALYKMNRAYLSLPEGTASVVGLIAMMTNFYNDLDGSGSERDSEVPEVIAQKIQKNPKAKGLVNSSREIVKHQHRSSDGCLSLLKSSNDGTQPRFPVRKRTPRVPVSFLDNNPIKKPRLSVMDANDGFLYGDTMLSIEWNSPNSSQNLQTTYEKECMKIAREEENSTSRGLKIKSGGYATYEEYKDGSLGSNISRIGILPREAVDLCKTAKVRCKKGLKEGAHPSEASLFHNVREPSMYDDRGARNNSDGKSLKICRSEGRRKRNKKLTHKDELAACDALHALAEISSMMPYLEAENVEDARESMVGQDAVADKVALSYVTFSDDKMSGKNQKKKMKAETPECFRKSAVIESVADEEVKSADGGSAQISANTKRCYSSVKSPDLSSSSDPHTGELEVAVSSVRDHTASEFVNFVRRKKKRKRDRILLVKDRYSASNGCSNGSLSVLDNQLLDVKGKLLHCLSWREVRKWCIYEWFYSAIDYPWFAKRDFEEYLNHVGLGHIPRLTRSELGVIRSSLGRPRRFSEHFLQVEREKLKHYRESVRSHYTNVRAGYGGLPPDLACPLYVGQQVVAIHPKTRECHNGSVLTVDHDSCRVQFHNPDLGVELVTDIDCMPLNPLENIPEAMRKQKRPFDYHCIRHPKGNGVISSALKEHTKNVDHNLCVPPFSPSYANNIKVTPACLSLQTKAVANGSISSHLATQNHSHDVATVRPHEAHARPIPGLNGELDRKVFDQHTTCPENFPLCPDRDVVGLNGAMHSSNKTSFCCEETVSNVTEIIEDSRETAQNMVDTAIKAMSFMEEDEDAYGRISEALNANCKVECYTNGRSSITTNHNTIQGSLLPLNPVASCNSVPELASGVKSDLEIPSDLITSCVATLLMIQTCTERQYPPAEVAQILNNAATSLHPCCPQNLSIYREIQMCMGRIKAQILALVPT